MGDEQVKGRLNLKISGVVFSIIVGATTMVGIMNATGGIANEYGNQSINSSETQVIQEQRKIADSLNTGKGRVSNTGSGIKEGFFGITQIWNGIEALFVSIPVANALIGASAGILGAPGWLIQQQNAIVVGVVLFTVIALYRGIDP